MHLSLKLASVALAAVFSVGTGLASASAAGIGVVLVHFRGGWPGEFDNIVPKLQAAGYATIAPEMCWSVHKIYSASIDECQTDIDVAIAGLKGRGVDKIVLAGHDFGGLDVVYYANAHPGIAGVVAWGPRANIRSYLDEDLATANGMAAAGNGDKRGNFNNGRMYATANALLAFEGPNGVFANPDALFAKLKVPLFWMAANDDTGVRDPSARFNLAPGGPLNTLVWSKTDQYSMVDVSIADVIAWLDRLKLAGGPQ
jgi:pimeloyl-ACP methyl ester carboxylesterase